MALAGAGCNQGMYSRSQGYCHTQAYRLHLNMHLGNEKRPPQKTPLKADDKFVDKKARLNRPFIRVPSDMVQNVAK